MPSARPEKPPLALTRRGALATVLAAGALGGCTSQTAARSGAGTRAEPPAEPDPDIALASRTLREEQAVLTAVSQTLRRHPRLEDVLGDVRAAHQRHVELLTRAVPREQGSAGATATGPASGSPSPDAASGSPSPDAAFRVSHDPQRALRHLAEREDALALDDRQASFAAKSGAFAQVLASMAGSAAQHAVVLRDAPTGDGSSPRRHGRRG